MSCIIHWKEDLICQVFISDYHLRINLKYIYPLRSRFLSLFSDIYFCETFFPSVSAKCKHRL